ncbi:TetR/AcrR family transcriptional regulator [Actinomadura kijaniata]|uniref:DNA-binding transcriptional regulator YbjK n=1 Tax=Actinomadura namibiensis TaxID=182080 RepID=A0A7W3QPX3_ACTNM|nr:TetR family transcriptional regulator [Actinomadura namibiensis]MBA8955031.1 DNA-binding transcriptional regulator YbjK [Actinomadura namibiensis]
MTPPENLLRRRALADAAIEVLGTRGIHQLSHRAVDEVAGVPGGTASNYFRNRDELLRAAARRVVDLHLEDMREDVEAVPVAPGGLDREGLADLIGRSLHQAATRRRTRFRAMFELHLEADRRPVLGETLSEIGAATLRTVVGHHRALDLATSPEQVRALMTLYGGALFTLVTGPLRPSAADTAHALARYMVNGVLDGPQEDPA